MSSASAAPLTSEDARRREEMSGVASAAMAFSLPGDGVHWSPEAEAETRFVTESPGFAASGLDSDEDVDVLVSALLARDAEMLPNDLFFRSGPPSHVDEAAGFFGETSPSSSSDASTQSSPS